MIDIAIFVSGPIGTKVMESFSAPLRLSIIKSTACLFSISFFGLKISIPSIPVLP